MSSTRHARLICGAAALWLALAAAVFAQPPVAAKGAPGAADGDKDKPKPGATEELTLRQRQVAEQFGQFEALLRQMAEQSQLVDLNRAAVLDKAHKQSRDQQISETLAKLSDLIKEDRLAPALDDQAKVHRQLQELLELLLKENPDKRMASEKERLRKYIQAIAGLLNREKALRARTPGAADPVPLSEEQKKIAGDTGELSREMQRNEEPEKKPGEGKPSQGKPSEGRPSQGKPSEGKPSEGKPSEGKPSEGKPSEGKPSEGKPQPGKDQPGAPSEGQGKPGQGKPQDGQPQPGQPGGPPPQDDEPPEDAAPDRDQPATPQSARKRLENAENRMRQAEEMLKKAQKKGATEPQDKAIAELEQAKAALEKILRQLRQEEIERMLTLLEARFSKMLKMQREVLEGTVSLDKVPAANRTHEHEIASGRLAGKEREIDLEADRALALLRDDGTAAAFPEALQQLRQDIQQVAGRLAEGKVDKEITQAVEEEIITSLEEMLKALKKALKDLERKKQQGDSQQGEPQDPPLVDLLAELKMVRSMQYRVNLRTERYTKMLSGEQATQPEILAALGELAERQKRIHRITRDLEMGKNR